MNIPRWALYQLNIRKCIKEYVDITTKWQKNKVSIWPNISIYKWDDAVESFTEFAPFYLLTGYEPVYAMMKKEALAYLWRIESSGNMHHGFWKTDPIDTEHSLEGIAIFGAMLYIKPDDQEIREKLRHIIEHCFLTFPDCQKWQGDSGFLAGATLGTQSLGKQTAQKEWIFNLGWVKLAFAYYCATKNQDVLNWALGYLDKWIVATEQVKQQTGYYVIPWEIDPKTGNILKWYTITDLFTGSGDWGWGYHHGRFEKVRDARVFLDATALTGNKKYALFYKEILRFLFNGGKDNCPLDFYNLDKKKWEVEGNKTVIPHACHTALTLFDDEELKNWLVKWNSNNRRMGSFDFEIWRLQQGNADIEMINALLDQDSKRATQAITNYKNMTAVDPDPNKFPETRGLGYLTGSVFGMLFNDRGLFPSARVIYHKADGSLGLEEGVTVLIGKRTKTTQEITFCNTNKVAKTIKIKHGFLSNIYTNVTLNAESNVIVVLDLTVEVPIPEPPSVPDVCTVCGKVQSEHHKFTIKCSICGKLELEHHEFN
jgi:hypothetical protein